MDLFDWIRVCSVACILTKGYTILRSKGPKPSSDADPTQISGPSGIILKSHELNDSLFQLHKPLDTPTSMCVIFLHGLQSGHTRNPHLSTWMSGDGSCLWPQTWLIRKFPGAHVLSVSYSAHVNKYLQGGFDIYNIGENLLSDLLHENIGQAPYCPVILVGHCFGGFVIKELCNQAFKTFNLASDQFGRKAKLGKFLANIRGIFYYGTPHHGSPLMSRDCSGNNLLKYFQILSTEGARLNSDFEKLRGLNQKWRIHGLGESQSTKSGLFQGGVAAPDASSRAGDIFNVVEADHIQICRPMTETNRSFYGLTELLENIVEDVKEEEVQAAKKSHHQNLLYIPEHIIGIEVPIQEVKTKLLESRTLALVGMGGLGKTTLAKAIFNSLVGGFEFSSFVLDVKLIHGSSDDVKKEAWSQLHHHGGNEMKRKPNWFSLKGKSLLLILDDVSTNRDLEVLLVIAKDLAPESRFIVTSRDRELVKGLEDVYQVPLLNEDIARQLFTKCAFPKIEAPLKLGRFVGKIIQKCDGLPLTLEVIGKYLHKKENEEDWEQTLDALGKADLAVTDLNEKLWLKLRLSFDGLQWKEQQIFLDVSTFFVRECTLREAKIAWKAAYGPVNERLLWRTLVDRSLVYDVKEDQVIQMHEQVRSLGRQIGKDHENRRRIFNNREAMKVFQSISEPHAEEVFALSFSIRTNNHTFRIAPSVLLSLKELRYLEVHGNATIDGAKEDEVVPFLTNLVFVKFFDVQLHFIQVLFSSTQLTRLVILELVGNESEYLPDSLKNLSALKILKLDMWYLKSLPKDIGSLRQLQFVKLEDCYDLEELPDSFVDLPSLNRLELISCENLRSLPKSFGHLSALSYLKISFSRELQALPESFGHLSALSTLQIEYCDEFQILPESFGDLPALSDLRFRNCPMLRTFPESFGQLSALQHLHIHSCERFRALPSSFGQLPKLQDLKIMYCLELEILPDSFAELIALRHLSFKMVALTTVPDCTRDFSSLQVLELGFLPFMKKLPPWMGQGEAGLPINASIKTFHIQDGNFALAAERSLASHTLAGYIGELHRMTMDRVKAFAGLCDECGRCSLEWPRYKSSTRSDHVLCPNCFQERGSNASEYTCVSFLGHHQIICDGCEMDPLVGPRYKSSTKSGFDLCHACFQKSGSIASEYVCIDPPELRGGTTDCLDAILAIDAVDLNRTKNNLSHIEFIGFKDVQPTVFFLQERGILKRLVGDLIGALEDLNKAFEIGLSNTFPGIGFREGHGYDCFKHRAYVKFLLGDEDGARRDAQEALSIRGENCDGSELDGVLPNLSELDGFEVRPGWKKYLGKDSVKFLEFEMI